MTMFKPFSPAHIYALDVQARHRPVVSTLRAMDPKNLQVLQNEYSWTVLSDDGCPVACCGITRNMSWAFIAADVRRDFVGLTRKTKKILKKHAASVGPVYAEVDPGYEKAIRWVELLGFRREAPGSDLWVYA